MPSYVGAFFLISAVWYACIFSFFVLIFAPGVAFHFMCVLILLKGTDAKADAETDTKANAETNTKSNAEKTHPHAIQRQSHMTMPSNEIQRKSHLICQQIFRL